LTNDGLRSVAAFVDDDLDALVSSGRLVVADYRQALAHLEPSDYPDGPKYAYRPVAWFGAPKGSQRLTPIAILPDDPGALQYAPPAGTSSWAWNAAKTVVGSADHNHHEIISHLARTHLFVEPFIVATHLALPEHHPVSLLLRPHFEGTIFINWSAIHFLVSRGGGVDKLQAGTIASDLRVAAESLTRMGFDQAVVPRDFAARGFGAAVPFDYPYRDDALALWDAMRDWVATYLAVFYADDGAVQSDEALQRWSRLVRAPDGGRVATFPELRSMATLVDALAAIMYAASALHAAGNFPQANISAYTPLVPGAGYVPLEEAIAVANEAEWLRMLPPLDMAALQLTLSYTLGNVHYTQLGRYDLPWFLPTRRNAEIQERLGSLHHTLGSIEASINARNARLPLAFQYPYLLPSQVPQSINI
jgi:arachidonate 15-lipoxygenase